MKVFDMGEEGDDLIIVGDDFEVGGAWVFFEGIWFGFGGDGFVTNEAG